MNYKVPERVVYGVTCSILVHMCVSATVPSRQSDWYYMCTVPSISFLKKMGGKSMVRGMVDHLAGRGCTLEEFDCAIGHHQPDEHAREVCHAHEGE